MKSERHLGGLLTWRASNVDVEKVNFFSFVSGGIGRIWKCRLATVDKAVRILDDGDSKLNHLILVFVDPCLLVREPSVSDRPRPACAPWPRGSWKAQGPSLCPSRSSFLLTANSVRQKGVHQAKVTPWSPAVCALLQNLQDSSSRPREAFRPYAPDNFANFDTKVWHGRLSRRFRKFFRLKRVTRNICFVVLVGFQGFCGNLEEEEGEKRWLFSTVWGSGVSTWMRQKKRKARKQENLFSLLFALFVFCVEVKSSFCPGRGCVLLLPPEDQDHDLDSTWCKKLSLCVLIIVCWSNLLLCWFLCVDLISYCVDFCVLITNQLLIFRSLVDLRWGPREWRAKLKHVIGFFWEGERVQSAIFLFLLERGWCGTNHSCCFLQL